MALECIPSTAQASDEKAISNQTPLIGDVLSAVVRSRRSCRAFIPDKIVPKSLLRTVLEDARWTPSACNTQPWVVHIVSGQKLKELGQAMLEKATSGEESLDFSFDASEFQGCYGERKNALAKKYYECAGVQRSDKEGRKAVSMRNFKFFDAPHAAFLFMPSIGDNVRVASDIGMYGQSFLLSLVAHGLAGIAQICLAQYSDTVREVLGIPNTLKLNFGISFGYPDLQAPLHAIDPDRAPIEETVIFHQ